MDNDPKYEHWIDKKGMGIVSGRNIPDRCTSEVKGVDGAKSAEASPRGKQDFLRGASVRDRAQQPWEALGEGDNCEQALEYAHESGAGTGGAAEGRGGDHE